MDQAQPSGSSWASASDYATGAPEMGGADAAPPSIGSALHGTGSCMPCAWYWKPEGCRKGEACVRCHLCPRGAMRNRRKAKGAPGGGSAQLQEQHQQHMSMQRHTAMATPATPGPLRAPLELSALLEPGMGQSSDGRWANAMPPCDPRQCMGGGADFRGDRPQYPHGHGPTLLTSRMDGGVASARSGPQMSKGSELHGTGACRPCAWFWKPAGCQNGEACQHCHLCPEGELRARKKAKAAARLASEASSVAPLQVAPMMRMTRPLIVVGEPMPMPSKPFNFSRPMPLMNFAEHDDEDPMDRGRQQRAGARRGGMCYTGRFDGYAAESMDQGMRPLSPQYRGHESGSPMSMDSDRSVVQRKLQNRKLARHEFEEHLARRATVTSAPPAE